MENQTKEKKFTGYPSIDKPWLKYYSNDTLNVKPQECTVYRNIYDNNKEHMADLAVCYFGNNFSYQKLFNSVDRCAASLKAIVINEGDCVTLCTAGIPEAIYPVLACSKIGAMDLL